MNKKKDIVRITRDLGNLVYAKGQQYGDTISQTGKMMELLYPDGIRPHQYRDALCLVRIMDKIGRIASGHIEGSWDDIAGYAVRMMDLNQEE